VTLAVREQKTLESNTTKKTRPQVSNFLDEPNRIASEMGNKPKTRGKDIDDVTDLKWVTDQIIILETKYIEQ